MIKKAVVFSDDGIKLNSSISVIDYVVNVNERVVHLNMNNGHWWITTSPEYPADFLKNVSSAIKDAKFTDPSTPNYQKIEIFERELFQLCFMNG